MAGPMDSVRPQLSTNPQPNTVGAAQPGQLPSFGDLMLSRPRPPMAGMQAMSDAPSGMTFGDVVPPSTREPQTKATPSQPLSSDQAIQNEAQDIDALADELLNSHKDESGTSVGAKKVDSILQEFQDDSTTVDESAPAATGPMETVKHLAASMRERLGRNTTERLNAVQSMYGDENAKLMKGAVYFRPEKGKPFRKFDQNTLGPVIDWLAKESLSMVPAAANALVSGTGTALSASTLYPPAAAAGTVASLAVGGATETGIREGLIDTIDQFSDKKQRDEKISLKDQAAWDAGINVATGAGLFGLSKVPIVKRSLDKVRKYVGLGGLSPAEKVVASAPDEVVDMAKARTAFWDFHDSVFPKLFSPGAKGAAGRELAPGVQTGLNVANAVDLTYDRLGRAVGEVDSVVSGLAGQKDLRPEVNNTLNKMRDILVNEYGWAPSGGGYIKAPKNIEGEIAAFGDVNGRAVLEGLANQYNGLLAATQFTPGGMPSKGGLSLRQLNEVLDGFQKVAENSKNSSVRDLYKGLRRAASDDRSSFYNKVLEGSGTEAEVMWKKAYSDFSSKVDGITDFKAMFKDRASRERMVQMLSSQKSSDKINMLDGVVNVLGENSPEWNGLRGQIIADTIETNINKNGGKLNVGQLMNWLDSKDSAFVSRIVTKEEKAALKTLAGQSSRLVGGGELYEKEAGLMQKSLGAVASLFTSPYEFAKTLMQMSKGSKNYIDYLADEGFYKAIQETTDVSRKKSLMKAKDYLSGLRDRMEVVNVPTSVDSARKTMQRYVPVFGPVAKNLAVDPMTPEARGTRPSPEDVLPPNTPKEPVGDAAQIAQGQ